jgi:hypothetical protein
MSDDPRSRVADGRVWRDFCRALERAGDAVLRDGSPDDPFDRAEGFRYLTRLTRLALESFVEFADPEAPVLHRPAHETIKLGADNPDNRYEKATISGAHRYRISGTRGTVHYLGFGTYYGDYGSSGRRGQSGYLEAADLEIGSDGRFEITVSCEAPGSGNWLPMAPDTSSLIVRQTFLDRTRERPADLRIERLGAAGPPAPLTPERLDTALAAAAAYVSGTANLFCDWAEAFAKRINELPPFDPEVARAAHGDPHIRYHHGYFVLEPGEALLVEFTPPRCDYWNFQLDNHWMESLDYRYHRIDVNHHGAVVEPDGSVRLVVAHSDPGHPNWIDTAGHVRGTMCLRFIRADAAPRPATRVVSVDSLA